MGLYQVEKIFRNLSISSASLVFIILIGIFITLFVASKDAMSEFGLGFVTNPNWNTEVSLSNPNLGMDIDLDAEVNMNTLNEADKSAEVNELDEFDPMLMDDEDDIIGDEDTMLFDEDIKDTFTEYGGLVPIVGTLLTTLIALAFALPIAMGIAVFLAEIAPKNIAYPIGIAIELLGYSKYHLWYVGALLLCSHHRRLIWWLSGFTLNSWSRSWSYDTSFYGCYY